MLNILWLTFNGFLILGKLLRPGGMRAIVAENLALKQQLLVVSRKYKRVPKLKFLDRFILGWLASFIKSSRLFKIAIILKPATILRFHKALIKRKYHLLFSKRIYNKPGPKGPTSEVIELVLEMKKRNPTFGYRRIAMQVSHFLGFKIDQDVVRRILGAHYKSSPRGDGSSWLTFIGHLKDSLWSVDLFRCESILIQSYWVMIVMDQFTRRMIGFSVHKGNVDGVALCCMFNKIIYKKTLPKYLSTDHDPLFRFHRWLANLRIVDIIEIKSVPYLPISHPFIERLIRIIREELLDRVLFWNGNDLQKKLSQFMDYYNQQRCHFGISGKIPMQLANPPSQNDSKPNYYQWKKHCNGLFELPTAA